MTDLIDPVAPADASAPAAPDDFDAAFAEVVATIDAEAAAPVVAAPPAPAAPAVPADLPAADAQAVPVAPVVPAEPAAPIVAAPPPPPPAPAAPAAPVPLAAPAETDAQKAAREAYELSIAPYVPTAEEVAAEAKFKADFPNEYAAVETRFKSADRATNAAVHRAVTEVMAALAPRVAAVESTATMTAVEAHFKALHDAHTDYDSVIARVPDWIKTQPSYLQPALQAVYDGGTTADVSALVSDYKKANGITGTAPAAPVAPVAPAPTVAPAKPAGAEDLAPVASRRSTPVPRGTPDPMDFDGAFAEAAARA